MRLKFKQLLHNGVSAKLFDRLLKQRCLLCTTDEGGEFGLCDACYKDLPWHTAPQCPQCGLSSNGLVCGSCLHSPPDFDATHSLFTYDFPLDVMMQRYKYGSMLNLGHIFGKMLSNKTNLANVDLVIAMPMHPARLKERGFNQALEIAKIITNNNPEKLDYLSVQRQKLTPPQANLPLKERVRNIKGAFTASNHLNGKRIAIIDDVMTTGASLNELAKTLKQAGASHVECWVVARTLPK
ncbi:ComF family protein [Methylotenera sp.]|uniref:ComF family protein n=1 Tax=Methylotenera sp. TaxID=2051956 RepID=UPI002486FCA2|nr:ComF family protein [Methylotenera sp.]MDI1300123.1 ComF family protein [Methylotenera sp.]